MLKIRKTYTITVAESKAVDIMSLLDMVGINKYELGNISDAMLIGKAMGKKYKYNYRYLKIKATKKEFEEFKREAYISNVGGAISWSRCA